jgi:hypothetical protein
MLAIPNPDKTGHHKDQSKSKKLASTLPSHPARLILAGRSGAGKGSTAKNILHRATPAFDRVVVYHYDTSTLEWQDCDAEMIGELPENPAEFWDRNKKNLLIIDEVPMDSNKESRNRLDRTFNYVASHYSVSVYLLQQSFTSIPCSVRRAADMWLIWGSVDQHSVRHISGTTGHDFKELLKLTKNKYDFIAFDFSGGPALRLNLFQPITDHGSDDD